MQPSPSSQLAVAAAELHGEHDVEGTVESVLHHARTLTGGEDAAVMLKQGHGASVMSATSPEVQQADQCQLELAEGPSLDAMSAAGVVVVDDVSADGRWRSWRGSVAEVGFQSVLSLRLGTSRAAMGALSVYSPRLGAFTHGMADVARIYAQHASVALASAKHESGLRRAIDARHAIGQAQGILMERYGIDADKAFAMLRNSARDRNVKLSERAEQIVAGH